MRKCVLLAALVACPPTFVSAQTPSQPQTQPTKPAPAKSPYPEPAKWFANVNLGAQAGSQDLGRSSDFTLYDEPALFETNQSAEGGFLFDIGGGGRLYRNYGIGVSYAAFQSSADTTFSGRLPHPLFFDQPRSFNGTAGVDHKEHAVHVQALWFIPYTDKIDFTVGIGPSFFTVKQGFARSISFSENPPDFNSVTVDGVEVVEVKESGVGFNVGGTMNYAITRQWGTDIGANVMLRYARGSLKFALGAGQTVEGSAGGFQFGAGIGVRF